MDITPHPAAALCYYKDIPNLLPLLSVFIFQPSLNVLWQPGKELSSAFLIVYFSY